MCDHYRTATVTLLEAIPATLTVKNMLPGETPAGIGILRLPHDACQKWRAACVQHIGIGSGQGSADAAREATERRSHRKKAVEEEPRLYRAATRAINAHNTAARHRVRCRIDRAILISRWNPARTPTRRP